MRFLPLLVIVSAATALKPPTGARRTLSRASLLRSATGAALGLPVSALAFDLPPLEDFENPAVRAQFADAKNPGLVKQQSSAFYAITTGDVPTLKKMADSGWDLGSLADSAGKTPLHRAAQVGNVGAVEVLLKSGSKIDAVTRWKETPLHFATRNGRIACVKQLVEAGASTTMETSGGDTPLSLARKYRMASIEEFLDGK